MNVPQPLVRLWHRLGSPRWFYETTQPWLPWFGGAAALLLALGTAWGLAFAPEDYQQGNSFRIIYIHVPSAILSQSIYMLMAAAGVVLLVWRMKLADMVIAAAAPIGAAFTFLALATGSMASDSVQEPAPAFATTPTTSTALPVESLPRRAHASLALLHTEWARVAHVVLDEGFFAFRPHRLCVTEESAGIVASDRDDCLGQRQQPHCAITPQAILSLLHAASMAGGPGWCEVRRPERRFGRMLL